MPENDISIRACFRAVVQRGKIDSFREKIELNTFRRPVSITRQSKQIARYIE